MTHEAHHAHDHGHAVKNPFPEDQWQLFRKDDYKAGAAVVGLMAAIFTIGLFLYLFIALWVAQGA